MIDFSKVKVGDRVTVSEESDSYSCLYDSIVTKTDRRILNGHMTLKVDDLWIFDKHILYHIPKKKKSKVRLKR